MARRKIVAELEAILQKIPDDTKYIGQKLVDELIFMDDTLVTLKRKIKEHGTEEEFIQGKQQFKRESTALTSYNKIVQRYGQLYKQLTDLLPKQAPENNDNSLADFIRQGMQ